MQTHRGKLFVRTDQYVCVRVSSTTPDRRPYTIWWNHIRACGCSCRVGMFCRMHYIIRTWRLQIICLEPSDDIYSWRACAKMALLFQRCKSEFSHLKLRSLKRIHMRFSTGATSPLISIVATCKCYIEVPVTIEQYLCLYNHNLVEFINICTEHFGHPSEHKVSTHKV